MGHATPSESASNKEAPKPWAEIIGPCYTGDSIQRASNIRAHEVAEAVAGLRLLELTTSDNVALYPALQVHEGRVIRGLADVLAVLRTGVADSWTWTQFLVGVPVDGDDRRRRIDALRDGDLVGVLLDAEHNAWAWRS